MKVVIGGFFHETSSFCACTTTLENFKQNNYLEGNVLLDALKSNKKFLGGYIQFAEKENWEIVPTVFGNALPSGPIEKALYDAIKENIVSPLRYESVDAVLLHLHGASAAVGCMDCEGDLLEAVRREAGPDIPVVAVLDLHANVSQKMMENATVLFGYNTYPHKDQYDREQEAAAFVKSYWEGSVRPTSVRMQPPAILPAFKTNTDSGPMKKFFDRAYDWEKRDHVINVSPFAGFYGSDRYEIGPSVVVTTDGQPDLAQKAAKDMTDYLWGLKNEFFKKMIPVEEAMKQVKGEGLWALIDEADDPLGGSYGDGTYVLEKLLNAHEIQTGVSTIHDPKIVQKAFASGVGSVITGKLGAWNDNLHGRPLDIRAEILSLHEKKLRFCYWDDSLKINVGKIAVIKEQNCTIVVTEQKAPTENMDIFAQLGIDIEPFDVLLLKGFGRAYQAVFQDRIKEYIVVSSKGITNPDVTRIGEFKNARRPIYPLDENVEIRYI